MDLTIVLTGIGTAATIVGANIGLISWLRSDLRAFEAESRAANEAYRKDFTQLINKCNLDMMRMQDTIHAESKSFHESLNRESRDFHGRLERLDADFKNYMKNVASNHIT